MVTAKELKPTAQHSSATDQATSTQSHSPALAPFLNPDPSQAGQRWPPQGKGFQLTV